MSLYLNAGLRPHRQYSVLNGRGPGRLIVCGIFFPILFVWFIMAGPGPDLVSGSRCPACDVALYRVSQELKKQAGALNK